MNAEELMASWRRSKVAVDYARECVEETRAQLEGVSAVTMGDGGSSGKRSIPDGGASTKVQAAQDALMRWERRLEERQRWCERVDEIFLMTLMESDGFDDTDRCARSLEALCLRYRDGMPDARAAAKMGVSVSQLRRIRRNGMYTIDRAMGTETGDAQWQ